MTITVLRDGRTVTVTLEPVLSEVGGEQVGRIGVELGPGLRDTMGVLGSVTGAADLVGDNIVGTVHGVGRIFGPEGIGRLATLVFTDEPRRVEDPPASSASAESPGASPPTTGSGTCCSCSAS